MIKSRSSGHPPRVPIEGTVDIHATVLHLMGIDHRQLTYRHSGRDFRLTDVHGRVITPVVA